MLYNFLWDDVARKQQQQQDEQKDAVELVKSPTTGLMRSATVFADGERRHGPTKKRASGTLKMNLGNSFTGGPLTSHSPLASPAISHSARFSSATGSRLTM